MMTNAGLADLHRIKLLKACAPDQKRTKADTDPSPETINVFNYLEDLRINSATNKELQYEACAQYFEGPNLNFAHKKLILNTVKQTYNNAEEILSKYMSDGQPVIHLLRDVRVSHCIYEMTASPAATLSQASVKFLRMNSGPTSPACMVQQHSELQ